MLALWTWPVINRTDIYLLAAVVLIIWFALKACKLKLPEPSVIQGYATITNTPGGLILILTALFILTLLLTLGFGVWVLTRGIDPQNATVILLMGMLSSGAFGGVSGALFTRMTGQDPKPPGTAYTKSETTSSVTPAHTGSPVVAAVVADSVVKSDQPEAAG
jgi:hypothetical protein